MNLLLQRPVGEEELRANHKASSEWAIELAHQEFKRHSRRLRDIYWIAYPHLAVRAPAGAHAA